MREVSLEEMEFEEEYLFDPTQAPELHPHAMARAAYVGNQCALARNKAVDAKAIYKRMEAQVLVDTIDHYAETGKKATVDYIKAKVALHPDVLMAEKEYLEAEAEYQLLKAEHVGLADKSVGMNTHVAYQRALIEKGL